MLSCLVEFQASVDIVTGFPFLNVQALLCCFSSRMWSWTGKEASKVLASARTVPTHSGVRHIPKGMIMLIRDLISCKYLAKFCLACYAVPSQRLQVYTQNFHKSAGSTISTFFYVRSQGLAPSAFLFPLLWYLSSCFPCYWGASCETLLSGLRNCKAE